MLSTSLSRRRHRVALAAPSPSRDRRVTTGLYVLGAVTFGAFLPSSLHPGHRPALRTEALPLTPVLAVSVLVGALALLLLGPLSDAFGARPVLRAGIVTAALGSACSALAPSTGWLLAGGAAQGLALGAATGAAATLVSGGRGRFSRRRGAVATGLAFVSGTAAGTCAGGVLAQYAPAPHVLPYALHLVLLVPAWGRVTALEPAPAAARRSPRLRPRAARVPAGTRALFATASAVGFLAWATAGLFLAVLPTLPARAGAHGTAVTGCALGGVWACSALVQPLAGRLDAHHAQLVGLGALLAALSVPAVTAGRFAPLTLCAAVVAGAGHGLAHAGSVAAVDARAPRGTRGGVTGALYLFFLLGCGVPALALGLLSPAFPPAAVVSVTASVAAVLVLPVSAAVAEVDRGVRTAPSGVVMYLDTRSLRDEVSA
ncbi:MFS transporter [Streptomyces sp. NPDC059740]|uniref:MFS transporter n=1 Tax=Streptomyces sp. NPDC059740 TaxID=3346926 RepID=UPI0036570506